MALAAAHSAPLQAAAAPADDGLEEPAPAPTQRPFKFTTGFYRSTGGGEPAANGLDLNLRYTSHGVGDVWIGWFRSPAGPLSQTRGGWDRSYDLGRLRVMPSLQLASGGFVGGSLTAEVGDRWTVGGGLGRTNLRPYVNLNFDPNDAWLLSAGYHWSEAGSATVQIVHDNRLHPDQQHAHLVLRLPVPERQRLTLDLLDKRGTLDDGRFIHRVGMSATYDWPRVFLRLAYDPYVNFSSQTMWRLSAGTRF